MNRQPSTSALTSATRSTSPTSTTSTCLSVEAPMILNHHHQAFLAAMTNPSGGLRDWEEAARQRVAFTPTTSLGDNHHHEHNRQNNNNDNDNDTAVMILQQQHNQTNQHNGIASDSSTETEPAMTPTRSREERYLARSRSRSRCHNDNEEEEEAQQTNHPSIPSNDDNSRASPTQFMPRTFPEVLKEILSDPRNADAISWLPHGKSFVIINRRNFVDRVLPYYLGKATKYTSFTRKLTRWNFTRVANGPDEGSWFNKSFSRDDDDTTTLREMKCAKRKKTRNKHNSTTKQRKDYSHIKDDPLKVLSTMESFAKTKSAFSTKSPALAISPAKTATTEFPRRKPLKKRPVNVALFDLTTDKPDQHFAIPSVPTLTMSMSHTSESGGEDAGHQHDLTKFRVAAPIVSPACQTPPPLAVTCLSPQRTPQRDLERQQEQIRHQQQWRRQSLQLQQEIEVQRRELEDTQRKIKEQQEQRQRREQQQQQQHYNLSRQLHHKHDLSLQSLAQRYQHQLQQQQQQLPGLQQFRDPEPNRTISSNAASSTAHSVVSSAMQALMQSNDINPFRHMNGSGVNHHQQQQNSLLVQSLLGTGAVGNQLDILNALRASHLPLDNKNLLLVPNGGNAADGSSFNH